jgi:hypothetical protein
MREFEPLESPITRNEPFVENSTDARSRQYQKVRSPMVMTEAGMAIDTSPD